MTLHNVIINCDGLYPIKATESTQRDNLQILNSDINCSMSTKMFFLNNITSVLSGAAGCGAMVHHRDQPAKASERLIHVAAIQWRAGFEVAAHRTIVYAARIAAQLFGGVAAKDLADFEQVMLHHAGASRWNDLIVGLEAAERGAR